MIKNTVRSRRPNRRAANQDACSTCEMSVAQQAFVIGELRRHRQVTICRIMLLVLLLACGNWLPTCTG